MSEKTPLTKSVLFEKAIKALLRPLTRALIAQGVTAPQLYRLVKQSYVDTAVEELGDQATDSRVSVLTGVHRRDVKTMRSAEEPDAAAVQRRVSTLATVVGRWMSDPKLTDESGAPVALTRAEFDALVSHINRDVRPKTILDELERQRIVLVASDRLRLDPDVVFGPEDLDQKLDFFARNLGDHLEAAVDNLLEETPPRFERAAFYNFLTEQSVDAIETAARDIGMDTLRRIAGEAAMRQDEDRDLDSATHRFRFGMYFYRQNEEKSELSMTFRSQNRRAFVTAGLSAAILPGAVWPQSQDRDVEGGLGGTGIVGVLVDFGSLVLAGHVVETDARTRFSNRFGALTESRLRLGDSLTVEAARGPDGVLRARRVEVTYPLVGLITARSDGGRRLTVNGVTVLSERPQSARIGSRVAVSGLWRGTEVIASRTSAAPSAADLVAGDTGRSQGRPTVGGVPVRRSAVSSAARGRFATVIGRFDTSTGVFTSRDTEFERFVGAAGRLRDLSIEGWLEPSRTAPGFRISGLGHSFARNLSLDRFQNQRTLFKGPYTAGRFATNSATQLPDGAEARRRLLRRISE